MHKEIADERIPIISEIFAIVKKEEPDIT